MNASSSTIIEILEARRRAERDPAVIITTQAPTRVDGTTATPPAYLTDEQLAALLDKLLPGITSGVEKAITAFKARKLSRDEALALGAAVVGVVSVAVRDGAPMIKGQSARTLVVAIFSVLFDRYLVPMLPFWLKPFAGLIKAGVVRGLESLYQAVIKKTS